MLADEGHLQGRRARPTKRHQREASVLCAVPACCTPGKGVGVAEEILFSEAAIGLQIDFGRADRLPRPGWSGIVIRSEMLQMFLRRSLITLSHFIPLPFVHIGV